MHIVTAIRGGLVAASYFFAMAVIGACGQEMTAMELEKSDMVSEAAARREKLPDLVVSSITRDDPYYRVKYCNKGKKSSQERFTVALTNKDTGETFRTNPLYPFAVPPRGECATTGGITCGLIGDRDCNAPILVKAFVDDGKQVRERNERNNKKTVAFLPDLRVDAITRDTYYYRVRYCNVGLTGFDGQFTILLENDDTGDDFQTNPLYPFEVPNPGDCATTGGITCGLIGDPTCDAAIDVRATIDDQGQIRESNERNNAKVVGF